MRRYMSFAAYSNLVISYFETCHLARKLGQYSRANRNCRSPIRWTRNEHEAI